jgi:hypothetical protein
MVARQRDGGRGVPGRGRSAPPPAAALRCWVGGVLQLLWAHAMAKSPSVVVMARGGGGNLTSLLSSLVEPVWGQSGLGILRHRGTRSAHSRALWRGRLRPAGRAGDKRCGRETNGAGNKRCAFCGVGGGGARARGAAGARAGAGGLRRSVSKGRPSRGRGPVPPAPAPRRQVRNCRWRARGAAGAAAASGRGGLGAASDAGNGWMVTPRAGTRRAPRRACTCDGPAEGGGPASPRAVQREEERQAPICMSTSQETGERGGRGRVKPPRCRWRTLCRAWARRGLGWAGLGGCRGLPGPGLRAGARTTAAQRCARLQPHWRLERFGGGRRVRRRGAAGGRAMPPACRAARRVHSCGAAQRRQQNNNEEDWAEAGRGQETRRLGVHHRA